MVKLHWRILEFAWTTTQNVLTIRLKQRIAHLPKVPGSQSKYNEVFCETLDMVPRKEKKMERREQIGASGAGY